MYTTSLLGHGRLFVYITSLVLCVGQARADEPAPGEKPSYGAVKLKAGFEPDPFSKKLEAGGPIKTKLGGPTQFVSRAPDFRLHYTAGEFILRIYVEAKGDTALLINLPDKTWKANNDGGGNNNPSITFNNPQSGYYDIWVGTNGPKNVDNAILKISEKEAPVVARPKVKTITLLSVDWGPKFTLEKCEMYVKDGKNGSLIYKTSETPKGVWNFNNKQTWALGKNGVEIQFKFIHDGKNRGTTLPLTIKADLSSGTYSTNQSFGINTWVMKYRIDN